jgi:tetratricopeptide (TPR) repeat protein
MRNRILKAAAVLVCGIAIVFGQAKQPQPKSQKELDALKLMFGTQDPDARIKAAKDLITNFADTDFKELAFQMIAMSYQQKNDLENMIVYAEKVLEVGPKSYQAMLMISAALAQRTREFDLDKEEKLARSEKLAKQAMDVIPTASKPNPGITDAQWDGVKKDALAEAHQALAMAASVRKKYDVAIGEYKQSIEVAATPDAATMVRLGSTYNLAGKPDDAIAILDKVLALPNLHQQIKLAAENEKKNSEKLKGAAKQ